MSWCLRPLTPELDMVMVYIHDLHSIAMRRAVPGASHISRSARGFRRSGRLDAPMRALRRGRAVLGGLRSGGPRLASNARWRTPSLVHP